jgi:serine/threonine-protein kinase RsbW
MACAELVHRIRNHRDDLCQLMETVAQFAADHLLEERAAYAAQLAIEELIYNTILYGCEDGGAHTIELRLRLSDGEMVMEIEDDARPFNPLLSPDPAALHGTPPEKEGGLGIFLVKQVMDDVAYQEKKGGNLLILRKRLASNTSTSQG